MGQTRRLVSAQLFSPFSRGRERFYLLSASPSFFSSTMSGFNRAFFALLGNCAFLSIFYTHSHSSSCFYSHTNHVQCFHSQTAKSQNARLSCSPTGLSFLKSLPKFPPINFPSDYCCSTNQPKLSTFYHQHSCRVIYLNLAAVHIFESLCTL